MTAKSGAGPSRLVSASTEIAFAFEVHEQGPRMLSRDGARQRGLADLTRAEDRDSGVEGEALANLGGKQAVNHSCSLCACRSVCNPDPAVMRHQLCRQAAGPPLAVRAGKALTGTRMGTALRGNDVLRQGHPGAGPARGH